MRINLLPVYSKVAEPDLVAKVLGDRVLPLGMELREHQVRTLEALEDPNVDIVMNTAMTGDGKSMAAYLRSLINRDPHGVNRSNVLGLYPTIELSKDQRLQFDRYQSQFDSHLAITDLWGDKLTELVEGNFSTRGNALKALLDTHQIVLTNPDIFTRMMNFQYWSGIYTLQELPWTVITQFQLLLFDEFHLFSMPQFVSAVTALLYAQEAAQQYSPKALFSSATQHASLLNLIRRAGLRQREITGLYKMEPHPQYRQILHGATLRIHQLSGEQNTETWMDEHVGLIEEAWRTHERRTPRVAIIVSSVAMARRIAVRLREHFANGTLTSRRLRVEEITGLSCGSIKDADIVVGTSTIDVGVDFDINLLIFEALNAGQFLQRLGRLGRYHVGEEVFDTYNAHVLVSAKAPWISEKLRAALKVSGVGDGDAGDRPQTLRKAVEGSYPSESDFAPYGHNWGALQSCNVIHILRDKLRGGLPVSPYEPEAQTLEPRYAQLFGWKNLRPVWKRYRRLLSDTSEGHPLLDEVLSFRGSSPFQVAVVDASQGSPTKDNFLAYDLFFVLQATNWELIEEEQFLGLLQSSVSVEDYAKKERELQWVLRGRGDKRICVRINSFREDRDVITLDLTQGRIRDSFLPERPVALKGFGIFEPRGNGLPYINQALSRTTVVAYISESPIPELRRRLGLPALFPLYRLKVNGTSQPCTVTFGKPALMLDSLVRSRRRRASSLSAAGPPLII